MALRPAKPNAVLAYLAHRGSPVRRSELAALLWPEGSGAQANASLRQALHSLATGPFGGLLERDQLTAGLRAGCDMVEFRRALDEGRWTDAFATYRGAFMEGFELDGADEFSSWLASERNALGEGWRTACRALLAEAEREERFSEALHYADLLVRADPLDEGAVREAMRASAAAGDLRGATRRYERLRDILLEEVGVEPEPATARLLETLRAEPSERRSPAVSDAGPLASPVETEPYRSRRAESRALSGRLLSALAPRITSRRHVIGREQSLAELAALVRRDDVRLATLLGPGGVGKSALAAALVGDIERGFPDGVLAVPLEGLEGADSVALAVAGAGGVRVAAGAPVVPQVALALGSRRALLVLDGFEPHLEEASTVEALLNGGSELKVVVTSRARLRLSSEVVVEVAPLRTRARGLEEVSHAEEIFGGELELVGAEPSDAARLFLRAAARRTAVSGPERFDLAGVERVVTMLGGNPLALELAAAWVDVLGVDGLEQHLCSSWEPLSSDDLDRAERARDVRAMIDETWQQLSQEDRAAWARLAVMPGSVDRTVATEVAGTGWRGLRRLLDRAVLRRDGERLELHALLARFGRERAEEDGLVEAAWAAALPIWRERITREVDPVSGRRLRLHPFDLEQALGAWRWALAQRDWSALAEMSSGLLRGLDRALRWSDASRAVHEALTALEGARGRSRDLALARLLPRAGGDREEALAKVRRGLHLAERLGDDVGVAQALRALATRDPIWSDEARRTEARAALTRLGDEIGLASLLEQLGGNAALVGRYAEAEAYLDEARSLYERLDDAVGRAEVHDARSVLPMLQGDVSAVRENIRAAKALYAADGSVLREALTYSAEAWVALVDSDRELAAERIEAFAQGMARIADPSVPRHVLQTGYYARFGPPREAAAYAERMLELGGGPERVSVVGLLASLTLSTARARLGDLPGAAEALKAGLLVLRQVDWPRFVPHVAYCAALIAALRDESEVALGLLHSLWRHPALECLVRDDAEALFEALNVRPPEDGAAGQDASVLATVTELLEAWSSEPSR